MPSSLPNSGSKAKARGLTLVTNNTREFVWVDGLEGVDWMAG